MYNFRGNIVQKFSILFVKKKIKYILKDHLHPFRNSFFKMRNGYLKNQRIKC